MTRRPRILVVDDDPNLLRLLSIRLNRSGYEVQTALSAKEALATVGRFNPQVVVSDVRMEDLDGLVLFDILHERYPTLPVIILTAHGSIPDAVSAAQRGVFDYLTKPFDSGELRATIERALNIPGEGNGHPPAGDADDSRRPAGIVTRSSVMETLIGQARRVAQTDASILILGESGSGKELLARAVHKASPRRERPFIAVNCNAIPDTLFESEFFGHRKGAFTGASESRKGLFEAANLGTLMLDEVGDMPPLFQPKLLRALEERMIRPIGASEEIPIDVRVISATNRDLHDAVERREFREDLLYRLNVVTLELPPLSQRREDIPLLAEHFLAESRSRHPGDRVDVKGFSPEAMETLISASWPGNVRQLRNVVEQCLVLCTSPLIPVSLVQRALRGKQRELLPFEDARDRFEFDYLVNILQIADGNVSQAARLAARSRSEFYKMLRKHKLDPQMFRSGAE
jgi:two-component system response regulator GlrR